jgi:uncharacterized membrane-anchored protein
MNKRAALSLAGFACLAALQTGIPVSMLLSRESVRRGGTEIRLALVTRDPRTLMRGDYSELNYRISRFTNVKVPAEPSQCANGKPVCPMNGLPAYVTLSPNADGIAEMHEIDFVPPPQGSLFIKGTIRDGRYDPRPSPACPEGGCFTVTITYGIEQWFGPQGIPAQVDRALAGTVTAVVRVASDGTPVLTSLLIDGKPAAAE